MAEYQDSNSCNGHQDDIAYYVDDGEVIRCVGSIELWVVNLNSGLWHIISRTADANIWNTGVGLILVNWGAWESCVSLS